MLYFIFLKKLKKGKTMKIAVLGTGAVGGYFGGKLAKAGNNVTFIARGATLEALKTKGLSIKSYTGDFVIKKPKVSANLADIKDAELILFCVKSYSTAEIAKAIKPILKDNVVIISMQNGIDNEDILAEILGKEKIIGSVVFITSSMPEPGVIKHTSYGKIKLGELNGQITDRIKKIEKLFLDSGVPASTSAEIKADLWSKLMLNVAYNGFTTLVGGPLKKYREVPEIQESFLAALKEVQLVARKEDHNVTDKAVENAIEFTKNEDFINFKSSTLLDAEAGKQLEIEALQGAVLKAARKHNLDIPINKLIYALLKMKY